MQRVLIDAVEPEYKCYDSVSDMHCTVLHKTPTAGLFTDYYFVSVLCIAYNMKSCNSIVDSVGKLSATEGLV